MVPTLLKNINLSRVLQIHSRLIPGGVEICCCSNSMLQSSHCTSWWIVNKLKLFSARKLSTIHRMKWIFNFLLQDLHHTTWQKIHSIGLLCSSTILLLKYFFQFRRNYAQQTHSACENHLTIDNQPSTIFNNRWSIQNNLKAYSCVRRSAINKMFRPGPDQRAW